MSSQDYYNNFGSYLRSRGFDKTVCLLKKELDSISLKNGGTINGTLNMSNNEIINVDTIKFQNGINFNGSINQTFEDFFISTNGDVMNGDLEMSCNLIKDVSGITFCDGTYIGTGNSFDISTNETLKLNELFIADVSNSYIGINKAPTETLDISGNLKLSNDIIFDNSGINILTFNSFTTEDNSKQLPSIHSQPFSLTRVSIFKSDISYNLAGGINEEQIFDIDNTIINQMGITISGNIIETPNDISNQYIEIYGNILVNPTVNDTGFSIDVSGIDCDYYETIDSKYIQKIGLFYLTFGPHIFIPNELTDCNQFIIKATNNTTNDINILTRKFFFKSYLL